MQPRYDLYRRLIESPSGGFSKEHARYVLSLDYSRSDHSRYNKLAAKANEGTLTKEECHEIDEYLALNALLSVLQSKARVALRRRGLKL